MKDLEVTDKIIEETLEKVSSFKMYPHKAATKTTKTTFDMQMEQASKQHSGISFTILSNNTLEYANIPTTPNQKFVYFENTSHLSREERKLLWEKSIIESLKRE